MPRRTDSNNPADWVFFAEQDLKGIQLLAANETSFYLCQSKLAEAVEKILKAELVRLGWFLRRIHDLQRLLDELHGHASDLVPRTQPLVEALADAYFADRYPGFDLEDPDWGVLKTHVSEAQSLLEIVKARLEGPEPQP